MSSKLAVIAGHSRRGAPKGVPTFSFDLAAEFQSAAAQWVARADSESAHQLPMVCAALIATAVPEGALPGGGL